MSVSSRHHCKDSALAAYFRLPHPTMLGSPSVLTRESLQMSVYFLKLPDLQTTAMGSLLKGPRGGPSTLTHSYMDRVAAFVDTGYRFA